MTGGEQPTDPGPEPAAHPSRRRLLASIGLLAAAGVAACSGTDPLPAASGAPTTDPAAAPPLAAPTTTAPATSSSVAPLSLTSSPAPAPTSVGGPAVEVTRGAGLRPQVALTFHGAGDPSTARDLLDVVDSRGARITVMVVGSWLAANSELASRILAGGHELGNHTWSHPVLTDLSDDQIGQEVIRCRDLLATLTGSPGAWFRPSSTQYATDAIRRIAGDSGYPTCLSYDIDSTDWTDPGPTVVRQVLRTATAGSIVSLHLGHPGTVQAMPGILDDLAARGLVPVTASTLLAG